MRKRSTLHRSTAAILIALLICCTLIFSTLVMARSTQSSGRGQTQSRRGTPESGSPEANMPNLDEVRRKRHPRPEAPPHIPSLLRGRRKPLEPRNGRKVGDPGTTSGSAFTISNGTGTTANASASGQVETTSGSGHIGPGATTPSTAKNWIKSAASAKLNHARAAAPPPPPPFVDYQYVQNTFQMALGRQPNATEQSYWNDILRAALAHGGVLAHGQTAMVLATREMGKTLFESADYALRNRSNHDYVYDLYETYLLRSPDSGGWVFWEGVVPSVGREDVRRAFDESGEFAYNVSTVTSGGNPSATVSSLLSARADANNQSGNQIMTRDAEWSASLLALPGRAGLDLGLALSYSSAATWTRSGPYIYFDEDNSSLSPGFRLGFPTVQELFFNAQTGQNAYLLITSAGIRVELRQVSSTNVYQAFDSSYLQLTDNGSSLLLSPTDGAQMTYAKIENEWRCTQIKDRNGNFISVNYNSLGDLATVVDTLNRTIAFNYDSNANLSSITQIWNGQVRPWATFGWNSKTIQPNFSGVGLSGIANGQSIPVLTMVGLDDGTYYKFAYTNWNSGQVSSITYYASDSNPLYDNHERNHTVFNYLAADDSTRLTDMRVAAENWSGFNGVPSEVVAKQFGFDGGSAYWITSADGVVYKEFYGAGWQKRLPIQTETWWVGVRQKWTTKTWTQENTSVGYQVNPRVTETNIYDSFDHHHRTTFGYTPPFSLPEGGTGVLASDVYEYAADGAAVPIMRRSHIDYDLTSTYLSSSRRIIGLPMAKYVCEGSQTEAQCNASSGSALVSRVSFQYDETGSVQYQGAPVQHDTAYDSTSITGRGNLSSTRRYDASPGSSQYVSSSSIYNTTGSVWKTIDPLGHQVEITYADAFAANGTTLDSSLSFSTLAYPTVVKNADGYTLSSRYHYDIGSITWKQTPQPNTTANNPGPEQKYSYDNAGRVDRITNLANNAYTRYVYGPYYVQSYSSINSVSDDAYSIQTLDGAGRVIGAASNHPGSVGGYKAQMSVYNQMGRVIKQSNPAEINSGWNPVGDDAAGWLYTQQTYDWKGRPLLTTNPDSTSKTADYGGCGCAGGDVVTLTDEGTLVDPVNSVIKKRQQKIYHDVLGRPWKTETLNWEGGSPYSAILNTYNARDQVATVRQFQGGGPSDPTDLSCPSDTLRFGTDTSWKQTLSPGAGWQNTNFNDSSWSSAVDEGAYGSWPWGSTPSFPAATPAHWIWYHDSRSSGDYSTVYFRKTFVATSASAVLTIRGDDIYTAYLNGNQVAWWAGWQSAQTVNL